MPNGPVVPAGLLFVLLDVMVAADVDDMGIIGGRATP